MTEAQAGVGRWRWVVWRDVWDGFRMCPVGGQEGGGSPLTWLLRGGEDPGPLICISSPDPSLIDGRPFSRVCRVPLSPPARAGPGHCPACEACVMMLLSEGMKEESGARWGRWGRARAPHLVPPLPRMPVLGCNPTIERPGAKRRHGLLQLN